MRAKYLDLRDEIIRDFWSRPDIKVGLKLPTERDFERTYKVSRPTVSKAIAALSAEGWVTKRRGSGIFVASLSRPVEIDGQQAQKRIGCVVSTLRSIPAHRIFEGAEFAARRQGCLLEVVCTNADYEEEKRQVRLMKERGVQGVVLYPTPYRPVDEEYLSREFSDYPVVVVDLYEASMKRPHLIFDNRAAGREVTRCLLEGGRKNVAFLKFDGSSPFRSVDDRFSGYKRALDDEGVEFDSSCVREIPESLDSLEGLHQAVDELLAQTPRCDAIVAPCDDHAYHVIEYLTAQGVSVPQDIIVAGFDHLVNITWGEKFPTTNPDFMDMGERAAEMLLERIASRATEIQAVVLPCPLWLPISKKRGGRGAAASLENLS